MALTVLLCPVYKAEAELALSVMKLSIEWVYLGEVVSSMCVTGCVISLNVGLVPFDDPGQGTCLAAAYSGICR